MVFFLYLGFVNSRMGRCQKIRNRLLYRVWINVLKINLFEPWHRLEQELIHIPVEIWGRSNRLQRAYRHWLCFYESYP